MASDKMVPRITPKLDDMYIQLRTPCSNVSVPLKQSEILLDKQEFDVNKKIAIFVTGWMSSIHSDYIEDLARAYSCRGDYNFLVSFIIP